MAEELNLTRQSKLVPEDQLSKWNIEIFGVGSVGSHVVNLLAKTGFKHIRVYDNDTVDEENIGPQAYTFSHLDKNKVEAMQEMVKDSAGLEIQAVHELIDEKSELPMEAKTIYMCFFDSFEARNIIWDKVKEMPCIFIDARIGKFAMQHYLVDCSDDQEKEEYAKSLPKEGGSDLVCGEKASAMINYEIAGRIVSNLVNYVADRTFTKKYLGDSSDHSLDIDIQVIRKQEEKPEPEPTPTLEAMPDPETLTSPMSEVVEEVQSDAVSETVED